MQSTITLLTEPSNTVMYALLVVIQLFKDFPLVRQDEYEVASVLNSHTVNPFAYETFN
jgi:hypothetical protein